MPDLKPRITVGELVAAFLEQCGVRAAFGVISIHNMPILDAFGRRAAEAATKGRPAPIRFVPARSEPGAVNMADAYARVSGGLGVAVTSTGTAAGQCKRRDGRSAHGGHAGPAPHRTDRGALSRSRPRLYPRGAGAARHAARGVEGRIPRAQRRNCPRHSARSDPRRAHPALRPGERRDPDRHPGDRDRDPAVARAGRARPAPTRRARPRRARRAPRAREATPALARRRCTARRCRGQAADRPRLRRRHQRAGPRHRPRRPRDVARRVQPLRAGREVLRHLRRDARRRLAPAR